MKMFLQHYFFFTRGKFSLNTVSIRVKFGSSKEKITMRRMYIYLISFTKRAKVGLFFIKAKFIIFF